MKKSSMDQIFSEENPFVALMTKVFDTCLLNLLWLIACIPIFTIGPATQAMYYVALKISEGNDGYIMRSYWKAFKSDFKKSVIIGLIMLCSGGLLLMDIYLAHQAATMFFRSLLPLFILLLLLWACLMMYVFAVQARFNNSVKETFRISAALALTNKRKTFIMLFTSLILVGLIYFAPILGIIDIGLIPMVNAGVLLRIFAPYLPKEETENGDDSDGELDCRMGASGKA